jgi:hypothetical protein
VNVDAPNPEHLSDHSEPPSERKNRHLAGMAFGFLTPLLTLLFVLEGQVTNYVLFLVIVGNIPMIFVGVRSWRRWFYPNRLPIRWTDDSVAYKRVRIAEWVAAGVNLVGWLAVGLMISASKMSHQRLFLCG